MNKLTNIVAIVNDPDVDPGPPTTVATKTAREALAAALAAGQLRAPKPVATALAAHAEAEAAFTAHAIERDQPRGTTALAGRTALDMLTGKARPTGAALTAAVLAADDQDRAYRLTGEHLMRVRNHLRTSTTQVIRDHTPAMLSRIQELVDQVHTQAQAARQALTGLDLTSPEAIAQATPDQRTAVAALPDLARAYNRARLLQTLVYLAAGQPRPGYTGTDTNDSWTPVWGTGVWEFEKVTLGAPGPAHNLPARDRILAVASRYDVWVPTYEQMEDKLTSLTLHQLAQPIPAPNRYSDDGRDNSNPFSTVPVPSGR